MVPAFALWLSTVAITQTPSDWSLALRLERGQDLVYHGSYVDETIHDGAAYQRAYDLKTLIFVLNVTAQGTEIAVMTVLREPHGPPNGLPGSVRLELGRVDRQGRLAWHKGGAFLPPLEGPPTIEGEMFVELPPRQIGLDQTWDVPDTPRPSRAWQALAVDTVRNARCVKLVGVQQTPDWEQPTGAAPAWRRRDTVWLAAQNGVAQKWERSIERRDLAGRIAIHKSFVKYELISQMPYPDRLTADRRREIQQAWSFDQKLADLRRQRTPAGFDALIAKIDHHLANQPATPYRPAIVWVRKQAVASQRGEAPAALTMTETSTAATAALGQPAPDFLATDLASGASMHIQRWRGRPVLLVFYRSNSNSAESTLRCAQSLRERFSDTLAVAVILAAGDGPTALRQRQSWCPDVPLLNGREAAAPFAPSSTPRFVVIDAASIVRYFGDGFGSETPRLVGEAVKAAGGSSKSEIPNPN